MGNILPQAIGFFLLPVFTRFLSPNEYGIQNYYYVIIAYLLQFSLLAVNTYVIRHYFICDNEVDRRNLLGEASSFSLINAFIIHVIAAISIPVIFRFYGVGIPIKGYLPIVLISSFFDLFTTFPLILFRVKEQALWFVVLSIAKILTRYFGAIFVLANLELGLLGKMQSDLVVNFFFALISVVIIIRNANLKLVFPNLRKMLGFSFPFFVSTLLFLIVDNSDRFILERAISTAELGVFSIAVTITLAFSSFVASIYRAIEPSVYKSHKSDLFVSSFVRLKKNYYLIVLVAALFTALFIGEIIGVMANERYIEASKMAPPLILAAVFQAISILYNMVFGAELKTKHILYQNIFGAIIIVGANVLLIPYFKVWGVGLAKTSSYLAMGLYGIFFSRNYLKGDNKNDDITFFIIVIVSVMGVYILNYTNIFSDKYHLNIIRILFFLIICVFMFFNTKREMKNESK